MGSSWLIRFRPAVIAWLLRELVIEEAVDRGAVQRSPCREIQQSFSEIVPDERRRSRPAA